MCPPALAIRYMGPDRRFPPPRRSGPKFFGNSARDRDLPDRVRNKPAGRALSSRFPGNADKGEFEWSARFSHWRSSPAA